MPCQTWWKVAILGCLCSFFAATTQAADCSGDYYYDEVDCSGASPAIYRPNIRIVVRRPKISLGGFAPAAPPQSYVTQPQQATTGSGAVSAGFPVFMMAAPAMSSAASLRLRILGQLAPVRQARQPLRVFLTRKFAEFCGFVAKWMGPRALLELPGTVLAAGPMVRSVPGRRPETPLVKKFVS